MKNERTNWILDRMGARIPRRGLLRATLVVASMAPASAVAAETPRHRPSAQEIWARTELYFGTSKPDGEVSEMEFVEFVDRYITCLLYTSDAADERSSVDLGGRRIIK